MRAAPHGSRLPFDNVKRRETGPRLLDINDEIECYTPGYRTLMLSRIDRYLGFIFMT